MTIALTFVAGFAMSFVGSIPPGTLNLTVLQLGLEHKMKIAMRFAVAAALVEYPYAWIAIRFQDLILRSPGMLANIEIISALLLIILGVTNLIAAGKSAQVLSRISNSGFRRGVVLSILNPMALPFWIGVTAYLKSMNVIFLGSEVEVHSYLLGITLGAFVLLLVVAYSAKKMERVFRGNSIVKRIPGITLLSLGLYGLLDFLFW
jgi:threonine/homoserine/homoserine lactone efflux protein